MIDMVQVVALDLLKQAHSLKQEEPTIGDPYNQSHAEEPSPADYEQRTNEQ